MPRHELPLWEVPADCALPEPEQPGRLAEFDALFATALRQVERPDRERLRLRLVGDDATAARARDLVAREAACCTFFAFDVIREPDETVLDVRVPPDRVTVLDGLERQARRRVTG